jgi:molybdopterin-containing oxidoreductase family membrane subunit
MKINLKEVGYFLKALLNIVFKGSKVFYIWMSILTLFILIGLVTYIDQLREGLIITNMRDQVSWGFYVSNFTFLVGIAAAAVLLIIPAYLYSFKPIKRIVIYGELLAISAVITALLFIFIDFGRPERFWHAIPFLGTSNFPFSILAWDMVVLNAYLFLNVLIVLYAGCNTYSGKEPKKQILIPLILISIPMAIAVHTVTAFVYNGLSARPFWNASILAPRFLASAFCSGPALLIIIFKVLRKFAGFKIEEKALLKLAEIIAYAMAINIFLMLAELYKEYYSKTIHLTSLRYIYEGLDGYRKFIFPIRISMLLNFSSLIIFLIPKTRKNPFILSIGCIMIITGVWIEKGIGLVVPGFIPTPLGEIYEYVPSLKEILISVGIFSTGVMTYTIFLKAAIALETGILRHPEALPPVYEKEGIRARDIMTVDVVTVYPETSVEEVATLLIRHRISGMPVIDVERKVLGVVSESDIIYKEINKDYEILEKIGGIVLPPYRQTIKRGNTAGEIMSTPPITAFLDTSLGELVGLITEKKIKRIVIVDHIGRLSGIVSRIDIVRAIEKITVP